MKTMNFSNIRNASKLSIRRSTLTPGPLSRAFSTLLLAVTALWALPAAGATLYVTNNGNGDPGNRLDW